MFCVNFILIQMWRIGSASNDSITSDSPFRQKFSVSYQVQITSAFISNIFLCRFQKKHVWVNDCTATSSLLKKISKCDYQRPFHGFKGRKSSVYTTGCLSFYFLWGRCWFTLVLLQMVFWLMNKINRTSLLNWFSGKYARMLLVWKILQILWTVLNGLFIFI